MSPFLWVALDGLNKKETETLAMAEKMATVEGNFGFKINLDYLLVHGIKQAVARVATYGRPIFADIKMWNGSRTMADTVDRLVDAGVRCLNVYALADSMLPKAVEQARGSNTQVFAVTILTHYDDKYCRRHFKRSLPVVVRDLTIIALAARCDGVILPGTTMKSIANFKCKKMNPGIRPAWFSDDRHEQETLPADACRMGASDVVCGSPLTTSPEPKEALKRLLGEL